MTKELVRHCRSKYHTHPGTEKRLGVPEGHVIIDIEAFDKARSLVDGVYEIVLAYKPQHPSQEVWRIQWLADARSMGAGLDEPPVKVKSAKLPKPVKLVRCGFCDPTMRGAEFCEGCPYHPLKEKR
jgi:hypothetical protein